MDSGTFSIQHLKIEKEIKGKLKGKNCTSNIKKIKDIFVIQRQTYIQIAPYTSYKIGGVAREVYFPTNANELHDVVKTLIGSGTPYFLLGGGSNVLVGDRFWDGAVIITTSMNGNESFDDHIVCGAGLPSSRVAEIALEKVKTGLEFLYLLPGSVGGALAMNARYDMTSISDALISFTAVHPEKGLKEFRKNEVDFAYKHTGIIAEGWYICEVVLAWHDGDPANIRKRMEAIGKKRNDDRHFEFPSSGCIFKNDHKRNIQAGKLLDKLGFKGFTIGGAQVAYFHANFIINTGNATARDVLSVIEHIEREVEKRTGIRLEREVQLVGSF